MRTCLRYGLVLLCFASLPSGRALAIDPSAYKAVEQAQQIRKNGQPVIANSDGSLFCEAEEFQVTKPQGATGWKARPWGENYYAATFANTFLSRKAFLGAPENCEETTATINVNVTKAGRYLVLVRYEAAYRFETQFKVKVEQGGRTPLDRLYGARSNIKIWAFNERLKNEVGWYWGAVENVVWEGHDAFADLQPGIAKVTLTAGKQSGPQAKRNVDLVVLTPDLEGVKKRISTEGYLPLDGLCTQEGDVWVKVANKVSKAITLSNGVATEHSPYWVHQRNWKPLDLKVAPKQTTDWIDIGSRLDSLNDGQWTFASTEPCLLTFGVRDAAGSISVVREIICDKKLDLVSTADTRYRRRIQTRADAVQELVNELKAIPVQGRLPTLTPIYAHCSIPELRTMFGISNADGDISHPKGIKDFRGQSPADLEKTLQKMSEAERKNILVVSLGDEIGLPSPPAGSDKEFVAYLKQQGVAVEDLDPAAGNDWAKIKYDLAASKESKPGIYYWSQKYQRHYGVAAQKALTEVLRRSLPNAHIGANFSPHGSFTHAYLGDVHQWVNCFRNDGMTLPWGEDYAWQLPIGTTQMNGICLDLFRAGNRGKSNRKILYYVMPHMPGNTANMWRRMYFNALGHGMQILNLFEFHPVWTAYTENHTTGNEMYAMVLKTIRELGQYEDIIQSGQRRVGDTGLWFSEASDIWGDKHDSLSAAKRALYIAILDQQLQLDFLIDQDATDGTLDKYKVLYLTDAHVTRASSKKIKAWVEKGGRLFATAGAGQFDEYNKPNTLLRQLLGVETTNQSADKPNQVGFIKQDLPFVKAMDTISWNGQKIPAFGMVTVTKPIASDAKVIGQFADGSPAIVDRKAGAGRAVYCGFLPGLSYFKPAIPQKPLDRGSTDDAMSHFIPTDFSPAARLLIGLVAADLPRSVACSEPLVESTLIESPKGTAIVLANWSKGPVKGLKVTVNFPVPTSQVSLGSGKPVSVKKGAGVTEFTCDVEVGDVIVLR